MMKNELISSLQILFYLLHCGIEYCIYENIEFRNIRLLYYNRQYKKSLSSMTGPPKTKMGGKRRGKSEFDSVISFLT